MELLNYSRKIIKALRATGKLEILIKLNCAMLQDDPSEKRNVEITKITHKPS